MRLYKVLNEDLTSPFRGFQFEVGKRYVCEDFDASNIECSTGFYATDSNGLVYSLNKGGKKHSVFEVEVGGRSKEFNQFKRRFEEMTVLRQLSEEEIKAVLLASEASEGYKVLEACYPINPFAIESPIPLTQAVELLAEWRKVWALAWTSVRDSVGDSVLGPVLGPVSGSVWDSVRNSVWNSAWDSLWDSVCAYTSSLFPNVNRWKYTKHVEGVNPFQSGIDLWKGGYMPSFDGGTWRLRTKNGIAWEGK